MRIIGGSARRTPLTAPRGLEVRPSSDSLRQRLFDVLGERLVGVRLWDACAGTGAVGLEALSRGASLVVFSEPADMALKALRRNIERCGFPAGSHALWALPWRAAARRLRRQERRFGIIYYDPPFAAADYPGFALAALELIEPDGILAMEHPGPRPPPVELRGFVHWRTIGSRSVAVSLYRPSGAA